LKKKKFQRFGALEAKKVEIHETREVFGVISKSAPAFVEKKSRDFTKLALAFFLAGGGATE